MQLRYSNYTQLCTLSGLLSVACHMAPAYLSIHLLLIFDLIERALIMAGDDTASGLPDKLLESLRGPEPSRMVTGEPALRDAVSPILDHVAVVADEEEGAAVGKIELHSNQAVRMAWQVVQSDALAEVQCSLVEGLPVSAKSSVPTQLLALIGGFTHRSSFR